MKISKPYIAGALVALAILVSAAAAEAQIYGGRSTGATATINDGVTATNYVFADTGQLPGAGGNIAISAPSSSIPGVMATGVLTAGTSGALRSSQSVTVANDVNIVVGGVRITANRVTANSGCICCPGEDIGSCAGSVSATSLVITDQAGAQTSVTVTGQPNQVVSLPGGVGTLTINEQTVTAGAISVNGLRINAASNGVTYDIAVAAASSSLICNTTLPTAADATVSGQVSTANGRPLSKAAVTLRDANGNARTTYTDKLGRYTFSEVESGETYILYATYRSYTFEPKTVTVDADIVVDLVAN